VTPIGELDILTASELPRTLAALRGREPLRVVFDLSRVTFIDSSGINALVRSARSIEADGGTATFAAPTDKVRRVFDIIHLGEVVTLVDSVDTALARARDDGGDPPPSQG
jgi:anti-anti-sigma factor